MSDVSDTTTELSAEARAVLALRRMKAKLEAVERARTEPIALVGMACRFPGGATTPEAFWELLRTGTDAIGEVPADRWNVDEVIAQAGDDPGARALRWGGFLEGVDQFDPAFFGITPREASFMDPQQRLVLEVNWEALEDAGLAADRLAGSRTGVFVGFYNGDYAEMQYTTERDEIDAYAALGTARGFAAGRLSYLLDLQGPCMVVDTICSSSLLSLHLGCQSLRNRECDLALASGVNLILTPGASVMTTRLLALSPDGRCKTFDARANGYVRGEGAAAVVLKRLSDAVAAGDRILALIRGSACNQDGRSTGLTAPSMSAQQALIRQALAAAAVTPDQVSYIEAHGTGTPLGDPIEVEALKGIYGRPRPDGRPVLLGSVKTNVGHLEPVSGLAGLMKVALAMQNEAIPPHLHFKKLNPRIGLEGTSFSIPTRLEPWPAGQQPRIAALSSFGMSGTNVHVLLEEAPRSSAGARAPEPARTGRALAGALERPSHLLTLSAKTAPALTALASRYAAYLEGHPASRLEDVCFTANTGRSRFAHRLAVSADSAAQLRERLLAFVAGEAPAGLVSGQAGARPRIAFLFTGQGAQYAGMGRRLFETQPAFRRVLEQCDALLKGRLERSLLEVLYGPHPPSGAEPHPPSGAEPHLPSGAEPHPPAPLPVAGRGEEEFLKAPSPQRGGGLGEGSPGSLGEEDRNPLDQTAWTQPALFALEVALAELWRSWGVVPDVVMGHSLGEYAAACVAGVFSLEDGLNLVVRRAALMQALPAGGEMAAVFAGLEVVEAAVRPQAHLVSIAALNGPAEVVISGAGDVVQAVLRDLEARGIKFRRLVVSHAFHSPRMAPMLEALEHSLHSIPLSAPRIPLVSNLTGRVVDGETVRTPAYWRRHTREPVAFAEGMRSLEALGVDAFVEIGPKPTLLGMGRRCLEKDDALWLPSLREGRDDWQSILAALSALYVRGLEVDLAGFDRDYPRARLSLPTYPFQRQRCWVLPGRKTTSRRPDTRRAHPLLCRRLRSALPVFEGELSLEAASWLRDFPVLGVAVAPAAVLLELAADAGREALGTPVVLEEVALLDALVLPTRGARTIQVVVTPVGAGAAAFQVHADQGEGWTLLATGRVAGGDQPAEASGDLSPDASRAGTGDLSPDPSPLRGGASRWSAYDVTGGRPGDVSPSAQGGGRPAQAGRDLSARMSPSAAWASGEVSAPGGWGESSGSSAEDENDPRSAPPLTGEGPGERSRGTDGPGERPGGTEASTEGPGERPGGTERTFRIDASQAAGYHVHPVLLEQGLRLLEGSAATGAPMAPTRVGRLRRYRPAGTEVRAQATPTRSGDRWLEGDVRLWDTDGGLIVEALGVRLERARRPAVADAYRGELAEGGSGRSKTAGAQGDGTELHGTAGGGGEVGAPGEGAPDGKAGALGRGVPGDGAGALGDGAGAPGDGMRAHADGTAQGRPALLRRLEKARPADRHDLLVDYLQAEVARIMGLELSEAPDPRQGLAQLGMDSLMAVELKKRLERAIDREISTTVAFDYPNIDALAGYLAGDVLGLETTAPGPSRPSVGDPSRTAGGDASRTAGGDASRTAAGDVARAAGGDASRTAAGDVARAAGGDASRPAAGDVARAAGAETERAQLLESITGASEDELSAMVEAELAALMT